MNSRPPSWLRQEIPDQSVLEKISEVNDAKVHTVCREAHCPNMCNCLKNKQLTFLILGDTCTRRCLFCAVQKKTEGLMPPDINEPERIAAMVQKWDLRYAVITSVTRDDLLDAGAKHFCDCINAVRSLSGGHKIEVLVPDFLGMQDSIKQVVACRPDVFGHNIETVKRLYWVVRPDADYARSLEVLRFAKECRPEIITKSSIMLGMGENEYDVYGAMENLRNAQVDILTLGQYLAPTEAHYPVQDYITPGQFLHYENIGRQFGFKAVYSGPLVRSSLDAERIYNSIPC
ncbi:MAG: lipoyl synthase [Candidatus Omnitrophica bacterium]|jgi:lipoic acid synthetase|nr:lipoyl synthase [Candidatus Omnitrophota bacterium]